MANAPKGTKDILPEESYKWQFVEKTVRDTARVFGAKEIRTPTFEYTEVFSRGVGEGSDIVNKEMYTFCDKGGRSITLKPEGTAGVARAFIENGMANIALPIKLYYITSCFRYERPQAGRLREFHQFGVEFIGSKEADIDAEVILMGKTLFDKLGIKGITLYINSIGCKNCRKNYEAALVKYLKSKESELCDLCRERMIKNPLRVLDCKNDVCNEIANGAPCILDYICDDCKEHFNKVQNLLTLADVDYKINPKIVRGLDYYTKTVFEFVSENIGAQGTVLGGGRYDGLVEQLGGAKMPGIGFAMGIERLLLLMENTDVKIPVNDGVKIYFAPMGETEYQTTFKIMTELRNSGVNAEIDHMSRGIKAQFKYADKIKAKLVGILGSSEFAAGVVKIKNMENGSETNVPIEDVKDYVIKI